jgi:hypothetical protein
MSLDGARAVYSILSFDFRGELSLLLISLNAFMDVVSIDVTLAEENRNFLINSGILESL